MRVGSLFIRSALAGLLVVLCATAAGPSLAQNQQTLVRVDRVRTEPLAQKVPVLGRLVARQTGEVAARVSGPVERFHVEVGDRVEAGQVLAELTSTLLQAKRDIAAADLARNRSQVATAQAQLKLSQQDLKRLEGLRKSAAFNQARYDDARQNVEISRSRVDEAKAQVLVAEADLSMEQINLSYTKIRAPYGGVVSRRMTEAGAYLSIGEAVLVLIADKNLEIEADVPVQRLAGLKPGTLTAVVLDDGTAHSATVRAVVPDENPLTRTRAVRLVPNFGDTERPLASQQSVTVYVPVGAPRNVLTVHKDAVIKRGNQSLVYLVEGDTAVMRRIALGEPTGSRYEVLDGLAEGDSVVVRGNERLRPGDKVRVDEAS